MAWAKICDSENEIEYIVSMDRNPGDNYHSKPPWLKLKWNNLAVYVGSSPYTQIRTLVTGIKIKKKLD